jgi:hypothetical protein
MSQTVAFASYQFMATKTLQILQLIFLSLSGVFCLIFMRKMELERKSYNPVPCCMNMHCRGSVIVDILLLYKEREFLAKLVKAPFMSH